MQKAEHHQPHELSAETREMQTNTAKSDKAALACF